MLVAADAAFGTVQIQAGPAGVLAERHLRGNAGRSGHVEVAHGLVLRAHDVPLLQRILHGLGMHRGHIGVQLAGAVQLAQDGHDAAGAVYVFDVVLGRVGRHLAQLGHDAREAVDVGHGEVDTRFLGDGQQVQDGIGGAAHGDIQRHRIFKRRFAGDVTRQCTGIILFVVAFGELNDAFTGVEEQLFTIGVCRQQRAVTRLRQAQRFGQTVHAVGREHSGAGAASRTGMFFEVFEAFIVHLSDLVLADAFENGNQVAGVAVPVLSGFHGAARGKNRGDVQTHGSHQHSGDDLVAVGD
ncbi:hypothetical protein SDC9_138493 [bioreactor metagenome]|uniref:NAD-specific glutamate dehydrogenase n=1 Tax=bioreactor metagenome TaxID=1076179 RepID=A0A645DQ33_9ZZZZ